MSTKAARAGLGAIVAVLVVGMSAGSANAYVYWTNDYVGPNRANLDGSGVDSRFIDDANCEGCLAVAVDDAYVYWTSSNAAGFSFIGRARLDGSDMNPTFIGPLGKQPRNGGLAVDSAHIYWTNGTPTGAGGAIARANVDGSGVEEWFITAGVAGVSGVSVDGTHIYWTQWDASVGSPSSLGRSNLDGSDVDHSFISDVPLWGTAVDSEHIYWASGAGSIARADLDGSDVDRNFITGGHNTSAVAVDGSHIYWTNSLSSLPGTVGRANLDGSDVDQNFIVPPIDGNPEGDGGSGPTGVAVDGAIGLDRSSIAFQPRPDHTKSVRKMVTLTNAEPFDVTVNGVATTGTDGASFRVRGDLCTGHTLGPGQSCTVLVRFRPLGTGAKTARLRFDHSGSPQSVLLSGTGKPGPWLEDGPQGFRFGYVSLGTTVAQAWGIGNVGSAPVEISDLTVEGPDAGDFEFSGDCIGVGTLGAGEQCTAIITFRPTVRGPRNAKLTITDTAPRSPHHVEFWGRGR